MANYLKFPFSGYRYWSDGTFYHIGTAGHFWNSSSYGMLHYGSADGWCLSVFNSVYGYTTIDPDPYPRWSGLSVRCVRN